MGLFERALSGDQHALARLSTLIENDNEQALALLDQSPIPAVRVIGITGPPGAGKSTLINTLLTHLRSTGDRIAVLLVDPSSQTTGGAVLGDRVRMLEWGDSDVFVRSQATRGQEGGLAASTATLVDLYALAGFKTIVIETVGVGQDGIDIRHVCDTTIVVQSPHQGDSVQSLKAGILEIADVFVVTKADLPGSHQTVRDLNAMVHLADFIPDGWPVPVVAVSSTANTGFDALMDAMDRHYEWKRTRPDTSHSRTRRTWEITKRAMAAVNKAGKSASTEDSHSRKEAVETVLKRALGEVND